MLEMTVEYRLKVDFQLSAMFATGLHRIGRMRRRQYTSLTSTNRAGGVIVFTENHFLSEVAV
jgi:hypothetical protein